MSEDTSISLTESVILGFLQGITEFLPISSSGHLVILQGLFGMTEPHLLFDVTLHVGTLAAILVVFRKDICELARAAAGIAASRGPSNQPGEWMLVAVAVGCIPTALIGMALSEQFERMFASMTAAGIGLLVTGFILMSTVWGDSQRVNIRAHRPEQIRCAHALLIGTMQGVALIPGISRSGATIAVALLLGVERELAARFSFLLAIPAILGALVFELKGYSPTIGMESEARSVVAIVSGTLVAAIVGIIALRVLLRVVRQGKISLFAYYCWAVGLLAIAFNILRG